MSVTEHHIASVGSSFQIIGPVTSNARLPMDFDGSVTASCVFVDVADVIGTPAPTHGVLYKRTQCVV